MQLCRTTTLSQLQIDRGEVDRPTGNKQHKKAAKDNQWADSNGTAATSAPERTAAKDCNKLKAGKS